MSELEYRNTYEAWSEVCLIFARSVAGIAQMSADEYVFYFGPDPAMVSVGDQKRLAELGWRPSEFFGCFVKNR